MPMKNMVCIDTIEYGVVKVSTGVMKLEKLSAGDASNRKFKYKR